MARNYPDNNYPSVTTALGVLRKIGLEIWFKRNTEQFCNEVNSKGKTVGTQIHKVIQDYIETGSAKIETQYQSEVTTALNSFMLFKKENSLIKLNRSEVSLTSEKYKYNGTIDCTANNGKLIIADWKTQELKEKEKLVVYDEYLYQVAAYVYLYNEHNPDFMVDEAIIVVIGKDKISYTSQIMTKEEIDDCFNEVFLSALKICKYQKERHFYGKPVAINS